LGEIVQQQNEEPIFPDTTTVIPTLTAPVHTSPPAAQKHTYDILTIVFLITVSTLLGGLLGSFLSRAENQTLVSNLQQQLLTKTADEVSSIKVLDIASIATKHPNISSDVLGTSIQNTAEELRKKGYLVLLSSQVFRAPDKTFVTDVQLVKP
jgi:hypothetical protein